MPGRSLAKTPLSEGQGCRIFVIVEFLPAVILLSATSGGDQGTLFARNVVQGYVRVFLSSFPFCVLHYFTLVLRLNNFAFSGAVDVATFHPSVCRFIV